MQFVIGTDESLLVVVVVDDDVAVAVEDALEDVTFSACLLVREVDLMDSLATVEGEGGAVVLNLK